MRRSFDCEGAPGEDQVARFDDLVVWKATFYERVVRQAEFASCDRRLKSYATRACFAAFLILWFL
jgi:hypothetical protein